MFNVEYSLLILKEQKERLLKFLEEYEGEDRKRQETGIKHKVYSLEFAIEVLEEYSELENPF